MGQHRKVPLGTQFLNDAGQIHFIDLTEWELIADAHSLEASRTIHRHRTERDCWFVLSGELGSKGFLAFSAIKTGERSIPRGHYLDTDKAVDWLFRYGKEHAIPDDIDLLRRVDIVRENIGSTSRAKTKRGRKEDHERDEAILKAVEEKLYTQEQIGEQFGGISRSAVSKAANRARAHRKSVE